MGGKQKQTRTRKHSFAIHGCTHKQSMRTSVCTHQTGANVTNRSCWGLEDTKPPSFKTRVQVSHHVTLDVVRGERKREGWWGCKRGFARRELAALGFSWPGSGLTSHPLLPFLRCLQHWCEYLCASVCVCVGASNPPRQNLVTLGLDIKNSSAENVVYLQPILVVRAMRENNRQQHLHTLQSPHTGPNQTRWAA